MTKDEKQIVSKVRKLLVQAWGNSDMEFSLSDLIEARQELNNLDTTVDNGEPVDRSLGDYHAEGAGS